MSEPEVLERGGLRFTVAGPGDEAELRALLAANAMPGRISLTLERGPDFFLGASIEGEPHQTIVAREAASGTAIGLCSRAVRPAYMNGAVGELGYLSQLRVSEPYRQRRGAVQGGFALLERLHAAERVPLYVTTIVEDNVAARRLLEAGLPGLPTYRRREVLITHAMPIWGARRVPGCGCELRPGTAADLGAIATLLASRQPHYQFASHWSAADLADPERCRGLRPEDFTLAFAGRELVGCVALWDQEGFKQTVIQGYGPPLNLLRPGLNLVAPWLGLPRLPRPGARLRHAYLSHLAVQEEDVAIARALLLTAANRSRVSHYAYLTLGLGERHPLVPLVARTFRHLTYRSVMYVVHWPDGRGAAEALDDRPAQLELATL